MKLKRSSRSAGFSVAAVLLILAASVAFSLSRNTSNGLPAVYAPTTKREAAESVPAAVEAAVASTHLPAWDVQDTSCAPAVVDVDASEKWGCKVLHKACLDHERIILHSGEKTPDHPNYTDQPLFNMPLGWPGGGLLLPGYDEPLGNTRFRPCSNDEEQCTLDVRPPTPLDMPDIREPTFNKCNVPLLFSVPYFSNFGETLLNSVAAIDGMQVDGAVTNATIFTPYTAGMYVPDFYYNLYRPFGRGAVASLSEVSSRERAGRRCYESMQVCALVGQHFSNPDPKTGEMMGFWSFSIKATARKILAYYKKQHPAIFEAAKRPDDEFTVVVIVRRGELTMRTITNEAEVLTKCSKWKPPKNSGYKSTKCIDIKPTADTFINDLAVMDTANVVVAMHGAGANLAHFLREGGALIEVLSWNFCGGWPDMYFKDQIEMDFVIPTSYLRLVAGPSHSFKGSYEKQKTGSPVTYPRDRNIQIDFNALAQALKLIATETNLTTLSEMPFEQRKFNMGEFVPECGAEFDQDEDKGEGEGEVGGDGSASGGEKGGGE